MGNEKTPKDHFVLEVASCMEHASEEDAELYKQREKIRRYGREASKLLARLKNRLWA